MDEHIKLRLEQEAAEGGAEATGSANPAGAKKEEKKGDKKDAKKKEDPKGTAPKAVEVEDPAMPLYDCHLLIESDFRRIKLESKAEKKLGGVKKKPGGVPPAPKEGETAEDKTAKRLAQLLQQYNVITATKSTLAVKVGLNQPEVVADEGKDETEKAESPPLEEKGKKKK